MAAIKRIRLLIFLACAPAIAAAGEPKPIVMTEAMRADMAAAIRLTGQPCASAEQGLAVAAPDGTAGTIRAEVICCDGERYTVTWQADGQTVIRPKAPPADSPRRPAAAL